eukprot:1142268-Pelagomonas_calceolata.AAC.2
MCDPRLLVGGRPDVASRVEGQPIATWMWGGMNMQDALFHFTSLARMAGGAGLCTEPVAMQYLLARMVGSAGLLTEPVAVQGRPMPPYPETPEQAVARYTAELDWIMGGGNGALQGNVLVVTHGEVRLQGGTFWPPPFIKLAVTYGEVCLEGGVIPGSFHGVGGDTWNRAS